MKLLFLDLDGVLCLPPQYGSRFNTKEPFDLFDSETVKNLNLILTEFPEIEIIISSDWQLYGLSKIENFFQKRGLIKNPLGYTHQFSDPFEFRFREDQIIKTIEFLNPEYSIVIDDMFLTFGKRYVDKLKFFRTDENKGLDKEKTKEIILWLNSLFMA